MEFKLNTIEEAIEEIKNGKVIIVVDDEDRENEGDFLTAARNVTPEIVNFMATHGRGLICAPLPEERCDECCADHEGIRSSVDVLPGVGVDRGQCRVGQSACDGLAGCRGDACGGGGHGQPFSDASGLWMHQRAAGSG